MDIIQMQRSLVINILRPKQNGHRFADIFKCILFNGKFCILIQISHKYIPNIPFDNKPALVQITAWHLFGAKPLSEQMMV